jgi:hypothetical protein
LSAFRQQPPVFGPQLHRVDGVLDVLVGHHVPARRRMDLRCGIAIRNLGTELVGQHNHGCSVERGCMSTPQLLDAAGRRRSPATVPGFQAGRPPRNKGFRYRPDPPRVEEIVAVMRQAGKTDHGPRLRALIVCSGGPAADRRGDGTDRARPRPGPRLGPATPGQEQQAPRGRHGRLGLRPTPPLARSRLETPVGTLFCVIDGQTRGRPWTSTAARNHLPRIATKAGLRRRFARISCAMPTPSRWPAKASRSS